MALVCCVTGSLSEVTIDNLKPETSYEVKVSAVNGKGEGESSPTALFKTKPVRKSAAASPPTRPSVRLHYELTRGPPPPPRCSPKHPTTAPPPRCYLQQRAAPQEPPLTL